MPEGFSPNPTHERLAAERGLDLRAEVERWRDWCQSRDQRYADWDAALRTWLRKAVEFRGGVNGKPRGQPTEADLERERRIADEILAADIRRLQEGSP